MPPLAVSVLAAIPFVATVCGIAYLLFTLWCIASFRSGPVNLGRSEFTPPVSILKPLSGMDPEAYESLRSHFVQDYPAFEIIFGVADSTDEIVKAVEKLAASFPKVPIKLIHCSQQLGSNIKVSNLIQMLPNATNDYLVINDSDIKVPDDYLRRVIAPLQDASVGMITCLYRGVPGRSIGSRLESLGISSDFIPGVLCALRLERGLHFGLGSTMAFSRASLDRMGGLAPVADFLADDYQLGYRMSRAGLQIEFAECVVDHHLPEYSLRPFLQHQLRWARAIRTSRPGGYAGLIFTFAVPWSILAALTTPGFVWARVLFVSAVILRYAVWVATQTRILKDSRSFRDFWLLPIRDVIAVLIWISCYLGRQVVWRGKRFELVNGKLREI